jgi:hypothetical protein
MLAVSAAYCSECSPLASEIARDILERQSVMETIRADYEPVWEQIADFCAPDSPPMNWRGGKSDRSNQAEREDRKRALVFDNTISSAEERLTAGLESLITPQSEKWHGISTSAMDDEETEEEKEWAEDLRDFIFGVRYGSASNFVPAIQGVYQNIVRFGPAYLYAEEGFSGALVRYASIPVNEGYIARNRWGEVDIFHRRYERTARDLAQLVGFDKLPKSVQNMANDPAKAMEKVGLIHAIMPRNERRMYDLAGEKVYLDSPFVSYHIVEEEQEIAMERSFQSFPISCFNWRRYEGDVYGTSPMIRCLTTVRELNAVRRSGLRALQQITDPATASSSNLDYVPELNPGANYEGLVGDDGRLMIQPINTGQNPSYAFEYASGRAEDVKDMMFVNLFQTLVQNPQMTATEALIRQEEKGALLGPAGSVIQRGFATNLDRELTILEAKGLYEDGSRFVPPESLAGKDIRPVFTSPLDVLRRSAEARDTLNVIQTATSMAQVNPDILDMIDSEEALRVIQSAGRAPQRIFRRQEEVEQLRQQRAQAQQAQQGMAAIGQAAQVAKDAVPAAVEAQAAGLLPAPE